MPAANSGHDCSRFELQKFGYQHCFIATMDPTNSLSKGFADLSVGDVTTLTRVSRERDNFIDNDYKSLDEWLMKTSSAFRKHNEVPDLALLLSIITLEDKRLVALTAEEAEELLTSQPSINSVLQWQKAWKISSFKEIRQLSESFVAGN